MAPRSPPRFVVRRHDDANRRRWLWWGLAGIGGVLLVALIVGLSWRHTAPAAVDHRQQRALQVRIDELQQQLANLQRAAQVNDIAARALRGTLAQREEEISGLRADLGFYSRLMGGDGPRDGLKVQEVKLQPIADSRGWNLTLSLTQNAKRGDASSGTVIASVEGLRNNKVVQLDWPALGDTTHPAGLPFRFTYFQQLHGTLVLPPGFRPTRLRIRVQPADGAAVERTVAWSDALGATITAVEGGHDVQP
jgi:hypothetical protein